MVFFGTENLPKSTAPPNIVSAALQPDGCVRARIHTNSSPTRPFDFRSITIQAGAADAMPMTWYGEHLWQACPAGTVEAYIIRAVAANGQEATSEVAGK